MTTDSMYKDIHIQPVILCCGSGTRLWPLSRSGFPKQFLSLTGRTTFQELVSEMMREDLKSAERDQLMRERGYKAMNYQE